MKDVPLRPPYHVLSRCVFISKKFPRLLAEREIIANAFISPDFSRNRGQRYKRKSKNGRKTQKSLQHRKILLIFALETTNVIIDDAVIVKYIHHVKKQKGATVAQDRYWLVEKTLRSPSHIYEDTGQKYLVYVNTRIYGKGRALKIVVHPNYNNKDRKINYLKSIGVIYTEDMNGKQYRKIK